MNITKHHPTSIRDILKVLTFALLLGLLFTSNTSLAGRIYKTIDDDGNVVFTDIPPANKAESSELNVEAPNTFEPDAAPADTWAGPLDSDSSASEALSPAYQVWVTSPEANEPIRNNAGNLVFTAATQPDLLPGHKLRFLLDGVVIGSVAGTQLQMNAVDRGTHQLKVEVINEHGDLLAQSGQITFHLQRMSRLFKKPTAPAGG